MITEAVVRSTYDESLPSNLIFTRKVTIYGLTVDIDVSYSLQNKEHLAISTDRALNKGEIIAKPCSLYTIQLIISDLRNQYFYFFTTCQVLVLAN